MNGFFLRQQQQYGDDNMQSMNTQGNGSHLMAMAPLDTMASTGVIRAPSFDGVVSQNDKSLRRASVPMAYGGTPGLDVSLRRASMMEFTGSSPPGPLDTFQFDPSGASAFDTTMTTDLPGQVNGAARARRASHVGLSVNTQLPNQNFYGPMGPPGSAYASPMHMNGSLDMDLSSPYVTSGLPLPMDLNMMGNELSTVDMFGGPDFESPMVVSPMHTNFAGSMMGPTQDPGGGVLDQPKTSLPNSTENSVTPDFRSPSSRRSSHQGGMRLSTRRTSASAGVQPSQMPSMTPQLPPPITAGSFSRQSSASSAGGPEMIAGNVLPWSTPDGISHPYFPTIYKRVTWALFVSVPLTFHSKEDGHLPCTTDRIWKRPNSRTLMHQAALTCSPYWLVLLLVVGILLWTLRLISAIDASRHSTKPSNQYRRSRSVMCICGDRRQGA